MLDDACLMAYQNLLKDRMARVTVPVEALACRNPMCQNLEHCNMLNNYAGSVIEACTSAANETLPHTGHGRRPVVPGWTEQVEPFRSKSILWHNMWVECGRPRCGVVADIMRRTRAQYHYAIRRVKRQEADIVKQRFAQAVCSNCSRDLWTEMRKITAKRVSPASCVDGYLSPQSISDHFANKYQDLYNCVSYDVDDMYNLSKVIVNSISELGYSTDCVITATDVVDAICKLKYNKNDGCAGLSTNHLKHASPELFVHISCLFSGIVNPIQSNIRLIKVDRTQLNNIQWKIK